MHTGVHRLIEHVHFSFRMHVQSRSDLRGGNLDFEAALSSHIWMSSALLTASNRKINALNISE
jgi:hypothetical protein